MQLLENAIQDFSQVKLISYIREKNKFGIWGDETKYKQVLQALGVQVKMQFPKIKIERKGKKC